MHDVVSSLQTSPGSRCMSENMSRVQVSLECMGSWWDKQTNATRIAVVFVPLFVVGGIYSAGLAGLITGQSSSTTSASLEPSARPSAPKSTSSPSTRTPTPTPTPTATSAATGDALTFVAMLAELPADDSPDAHTGYERDLFNAWIDANGDGCDTRAEVLKTESLPGVPVTKRNTCTIETGSWYSAYDAVWFTDAGDVDIDHFVPLKEAWVSGAWQWKPQTRVAFGNDLGYAASLIAVSASSNRSKSDQDPAEWLPANTDYYCDYAATWVAVKWRWNLSVDAPERSALGNLLSGCSTLTVVVPERASIAIDPNAISGTPANGGNGSGDGVVDQDFGTCKNAKANGYGPYIRGVDPEYNFYRDGDGDGMVCE